MEHINVSGCKNSILIETIQTRFIIIPTFCFPVDAGEMFVSGLGASFRTRRECARGFALPTVAKTCAPKTR